MYFCQERTSAVRGGVGVGVSILLPGCVKIKNISLKSVPEEKLGFLKILRGSWLHNV